LTPSSALPLAYYLVAYTGFAAGLAVLAVDPSLPGTSFYHPRFVALVHLLTLAWLTGSILGSLYIIGPLALRVPMPVRRADWISFGSFVFGVSGMVAHFWINTYDGMAWSAAFVIGAVLHVGVRVIAGLRRSPVAAGVRLHVVLAFVNVGAAAAAGMLIGFDRSRGVLAVSPLALMFAHAHVAAVGFVAMLVIGLSYRLIPMLLPAELPAGRSLGLSALLVQCGLAALTAGLLLDSATWPGALIIAGGIASFVTHVRRMLVRRRPRPPALPARDWSTWQIHMAFVWLLVALAIGVLLSIGVSDARRLQMMWMYGAAGLVGFLAQMVVGMQGRLVPLYAWYRAYASTESPPARAANALLSVAFARSIFLCWAVAVPALVWGVSQTDPLAIRVGAVGLLSGLGVGAAYLLFLLNRA
jgi:hypothetical protein